MRQDDFLEAIKGALQGPIDPAQFEPCMCDLLQEEFPGLAPIPGGQDEGMDGAIPDGHGEPFALICTTAKNVIGNLARSLKSYKSGGGPRRLAVLVTSVALTAARIKNLKAKARELGFTLVQVIEQEGVATRLYRRPDLCNRLLGLTGNPPALSRIPLTRRPLGEGEAIGREEDISWLRVTTTDSVLVGQPGSGKTFLLYSLAKADWGLFVVTDDRAQIANAIRRFRPPVIIVDDAHVRPSLLESLVQLRRELRTGFRLLATCWPGSQGQVCSVLNPAPQRIRTLSVLPRDVMVKIVRQAGVFGPDDLVRTILTQARGKPGLAATLADLCIRGGERGVRDVWTGEALRTQIGSALGGSASTLEILTCFAVGGKAGMAIDAVAQFVGLPVLEVRQRLADLSQGGVLQVLSNGRVAILPSVLRYALLKGVLSGTALPFDVLPLLPRAPDLVEAFEVLVGAKSIGAPISDGYLRALAGQINQPESWTAYAELGREEFMHALEVRPDLLVEITSAGLFHAPDHVIASILRHSIGNAENLNSQTSHPMRKLQDWVAVARPGDGMAIERRVQLVGAIEAWVGAGGNPGIGVHALSFAFNPLAHWITSDPGSGRTITLFYAILTEAELRELQRLWTRAAPILPRGRPSGDWRPMLEVLHSLMHPHLPRGEVPADSFKESRKLARRMLRDMAGFARGHSGLLAELSRRAREIKMRLAVDVDADYEILFPRERLNRDSDVQTCHQFLAVDELAARWASCPPEDIAERLEWLEEQARGAGHSGGRWTPTLCVRLAAATPNPPAWTGAFLARSLYSDLVRPFLHASIGRGDSAANEHIESCLRSPRYQWIGITAAYAMSPSNPALQAFAFGLLGEHARGLQMLVHRHEIRPEALRAMLSHDDPRVVEAAVSGMWATTRLDSHYEDLREDWRRAIVRCGPTEYALQRILRSDSSLAFEWLVAHLDGEGFNPYLHRETAFDAALRALSSAQRCELLERVPDDCDHLGRSLVARIVGDDLSVYNALLSRPNLRHVHLVPLANASSGSLPPMLIAAARAGYSTRELAQNVFGHRWSWSGNASDMWRELEDRYSGWATHPDSTVRSVAAECLNMARAHLNSAETEERNELVDGLNQE